MNEMPSYIWSRCWAGIRRQEKRMAWAAMLAAGTWFGMDVEPVKAQTPAPIISRAAFDRSQANPHEPIPAPLPPHAIGMPQDEMIIGPVDETVVAHGDWGAPVPAADCGLGCGDRWYVQAEALYFDREVDENVTLSRAFALDGFEYEWGGRITLGRQYDCLDGWEATYVGPFDWRSDDQRSDAGGGLQSVLAPGGGLTAANVTAFNNAVFHRQIHESELQSFEFNRKWWGWDVFNATLGVRYVDLEEEFLFTSVRGNGDVGVLLYETENDLIGPQLGLEVLYPYTQRLTIGTRGKIGAYANFTEGNVALVNAGTLVLNNGDDDVEFAALGELAVNASYQLSPGVAIRGGYEGWYVYGVALAAEQNFPAVTASTGTHVDDNGDVFLHGFTTGVELSW